MSKFLVQYNLHIDETRRPKEQGFEPIYVVNEVYEIEDGNDRALATVINERYETFIKDPGMTVFKDSTRILPNGTGNIENRMFIPWHMIAYMDATVKHIPEPVRNPLDSLVPADQSPTDEKEIVH